MYVSSLIFWKKEVNQEKKGSLRKLDQMCKKANNRFNFGAMMSFGGM